MLSIFAAISQLRLHSTTPMVLVTMSVHLIISILPNLAYSSLTCIEPARVTVTTKGPFTFTCIEALRTCAGHGHY